MTCPEILHGLPAPAERPERSWLWVDRDDGGTWADLHEFAAAFGNNDDAGGGDGFFLLQRTSQDRDGLLSSVPDGISGKCMEAGTPAGTEK